MLDIQFIREHKDRVAKAIATKKSRANLDALLAKDAERSRLLKEVEELRSLKNDINELIQQAKTPEEKAEVIAKGKEIKEKLDVAEPHLREAEEQFFMLLRLIPNIPSDDTPEGPDESGNQVLRQVGEKRTFDFTPKEHFELGQALGLIDTERAATVAGARFAYLMGDLVKLQFALIDLALKTLTDEKALAGIIAKNNLDVSATPFIPVIPPVFIKPEPFEKMARLEPKEERYYLPEDDLYLIGSAEHTLGTLHMDESIPEEKLPLRYVGYSTSFRREAGSYGKDTRGILRLHQFDKLEMESFTTAKKSVEEQNFFVAIQEYLVRSLGIPYQVVQICTGDMGGPDARQIDIECWLPGQGKYRETHTSDLMTDYQARRLGTKVKRRDGRSEFVQMNDATVFAIGRTLIAIMENYQEADGGIVIPEALRPYMGKEKIVRVA